jgi:L-ribulose-5-phosphate 3-epimerase
LPCIAAFESLARYVVSVHAKDGDPPAAAFPGQLGIERPLGKGSVDIPRFLEALRRSGYNGTVNVEREIEEQRQRMAEIRAAVEWLRTLV